jgi:hypothetical protein
MGGKVAHTGGAAGRTSRSKACQANYMHNNVAACAVRSMAAIPSCCLGAL